MDLVADGQFEWGRKVSIELSIDSNLLIDLLLPIGNVGGSGLVELSDLLLGETFRTAQESRSELVTLDLGGINLRGGDNNMRLRKTSQRNFINAIRAGNKDLTVFKTTDENSTLSSMLARKDDNNTASFETLAKSLLQRLSIDSTLSERTEFLLHVV